MAGPSSLSLPLRIAFLPVGLLLRLLALLPFPALYVLSDGIAFLARDIVRYRRRVVAANIDSCFPDLGAAERRRMARRFYRHLADYFVETVKFPFMSRRVLMRRMRFENTEIIDSTLESERDIVRYILRISATGSG